MLKAMEDLGLIAAALGDPLRIRILDLLAEGRRTACSSPEHPETPVAVCACDLGARLGGLAPSKLAYHLAQLRAAGLVSEQRRGKWVYYLLNEQSIEAFSQALASRWKPAQKRSSRNSGAVSKPRTSKR
jgi:ArsR family transcriptional regulator, arsenate/arsenite/antimonite-responsive transcriptional repressor